MPEGPPFVSTSQTSAEAAESVREGAAELRERVYSALKRVWPEGLTDEQMQQALGMQGNTQRPRRRELEQRGLVRDSGERRFTTSGRRAVVWVCND
jgi:hypothetical protein